MSIQPFFNARGGLIAPYPSMPLLTTSTTTLVIDATGENFFGIGYIYLTSGPGTSKVFSSAGGKIHYSGGAVTFANAGSSVRFGVQDVTAGTGAPDGTFDTFADLTGGGGGITANAINTITMTNGTKTIAHGDLIAIGATFTTRAGSDSIGFHRARLSGQPYIYNPNTKVVSLPLICIEFDDGTFGFFDGCPYTATYSTVNFNSGSTPDEYGLIFELPGPARLGGMQFITNNIAGTFEIIIYSDPLGTPSAIETLTQTTALMAAQIYIGRPFTTVIDLAANTKYCLALRPITASAIEFIQQNFGTGNSNLRKQTDLGTNWSLGTRSNQTGAFTEDTEKLPLIGLLLSGIDDGSGGGSSEHSFTF